MLAGAREWACPAPIGYDRRRCNRQMNTTTGML
ncbi:hypothetical protein [Pseudomonas phage PAShipCat1]